MSDTRLTQATAWLHTLGFGDFQLLPLAGDASFRRYFRMTTSEETLVLMDAPPNKEDIIPFIKVCHWLRHAGLRVPRIEHTDTAQGFLLLEDFGDVTWASYIRKHGAEEGLFEDALHQIHLLQQAANTLKLPSFDMPRMEREVALYLDWYLPHIQQYTPNPKERAAFYQALSPVLRRVASLPQAPVHLDYHSRNLMLPASELPLGIIDFQDAVTGAITYDLASLLYDCYQDYPEAERFRWSRYFFDHLQPQQQQAFQSVDDWHQALRTTALQRHIKVLGIFARLAYRDGKRQFLDEIPLTHKHCMDNLTALALSIPLVNA